MRPEDYKDLRKRAPTGEDREIVKEGGSCCDFELVARCGMEH